MRHVQKYKFVWDFLYTAILSGKGTLRAGIYNVIYETPIFVFLGIYFPYPSAWVYTNLGHLKIRIYAI